VISGIRSWPRERGVEIMGRAVENGCSLGGTESTILVLFGNLGDVGCGNLGWKWGEQINLER
jgi:hypothetical protein